MTVKAAACAAVLSAGLGRDAGAQKLRIGVTWSIPDDENAALAELFEIRGAGIRLVRTGPVHHESLLVAADSIGMSFFQDIPLLPLPAGALVDSTEYALNSLRSILGFAERYAAARQVGLARLADTSEPDACHFFADLVEEARDAPVPITVYYTTVFRESDVCAEEVDGVLLEVPDVPIDRVNEILRREAGQDRLMGFASLGTWVDLDLDNMGYQSPHSEEWQARYIEETLAAVSAASPSGPALYAFVHRWKDPAGIVDSFWDLTQRRYGLLNSSGGERPSYDVASGFATGRQTVFAFESGVASGSRWLWMTLFGWTCLAGLGLVYASSPQMRHMVPRYFRSHGFYREAVASGRESLPAETIALLACVSIGVGMSLSTLTFELSTRPVFLVAKSWMDPEVRDFVGALLDQPWTLTVVIASLYGLVNVFWTSIMSLSSRFGRTLLPAQCLMLIVWPQWPLLLLLVGAPATAAADPAIRFVGASGLVAAALVLMGVAFVRSTLDFASISRPRAWALAGGLMLHPLLVGSLVALAFALGEYSDRAGYVVHLLTRR